MLTTLALTAILAGQTRTMNLPKIAFEQPVIGGQREILLGPKPIEFTLLNGYSVKEVNSKSLTTGSNTGGQYVDSWMPGGTQEDPLGYFDCITRADSLFDKPCIVITSTAKWNQKMGRKPNE